MSEIDTDAMRQRLEEERGRLTAAVQFLERENPGSLEDELGEIAAGNDNHLGDLATATYDRELDEGLEEGAQQTLEDVELALRKLDEGSYDALVLAVAGLDRLGLADRVTVRLTPPEVYPAVGQGALGLECRSDDLPTRHRLEQISDVPTFAATTAERQVLATLHAGCHAPVGVAVTFSDESLTLEAVVLSRDGKQRLVTRQTGPLSDPRGLGNAVAQELLRQGAAPLIEAAEAK